MFTHCTTPQEVKDLYRELALKHHPDRGGSTSKMQDINAAYAEALKAFDGFETRGTDGKTHTYNYREDTEETIIEFIDNLLRTLPQEADIEILLIGLWVWVKGDTRPIKDTLKALKMIWHSKRKCWYWKPYRGRKSYYAKNMSLGDLQSVYGGGRIKRKANGKQRNRTPAQIQ